MHFAAQRPENPRLIVAYIVTGLKETGERRIELSSNFGGFIKEVGYTGNLRGSTRASRAVQGQLLRLLKSNIAFEKVTGDEDQGSILSGKADVASKFALWWDYRHPEQGSLFGSFTDLSEEFYNAVIANPVPLRSSATGIAEENYRKYRQQLRIALRKIAEQWLSPEGKSVLNYELHEDGLTLFRRPQPKTTSLQLGVQTPVEFEDNLSRNKPELSH